MGRRPAPEPALPRTLDRAAGPRLGAAAEGPGRPRVRPAARPRQAALGDLAGRRARGRPLRDAVEDPPRACRRHLRRGHHVRALRHVARARRAGGHRRALAAAPSPLLRAALRRGAHGARHDPGRAGPLGASGVPWPANGARGPARRRRGRRRHGLGGAQPRSPHPLQQVDRPAPPLHVGAREPRRPQGDQERARRHGERRRARHGGGRARQAPAPPRPEHRRPRAEGHGPRERARRRGARRPRQPRGRHDGPAPRLVPGPGRAPRHRARGAEGPEVRRPGRGRPGAHRAVRLRARPP